MVKHRFHVSTKPIPSGEKQNTEVPWHQPCPCPRCPPPIEALEQGDMIAPTAKKDAYHTYETMWISG